MSSINVRNSRDPRTKKRSGVVAVPLNPALLAEELIARGELGAGGTPPALAARLLHLAHPGRVLMPVRPEMRDRYPPDWPAISHRIQSLLPRTSQPPTPSKLYP